MFVSSIDEIDPVGTPRSIPHSFGIGNMSASIDPLSDVEVFEYNIESSIASGRSWAPTGL